MARAELPEALPSRVRVHGRAQGPQHRQESAVGGRMSTPSPTPPVAASAPPPASATPQATAPPADPNVVNIEVNGVPLKARKGQMLIEVTDRADIYVPRF